MQIINLSLNPKQVKAVIAALEHAYKKLIDNDRSLAADRCQDMIIDINAQKDKTSTTTAIILKLTGGRTDSLVYALKVAKYENIITDQCDEIIEDLTTLSMIRRGIIRKKYD